MGVGDAATREELVKIDIIAGFLGAGKTTMINKLLEGAVAPAETVLIENEFGEVSIDDDLLRGSGMEMKTLASGCICCTLRGSFAAVIPELIEQYHPKRIIIEPTGMAAPADLLSICADVRRWGAPIEVNTLFSIMNARNIEKLLRYDVPAFAVQFENVSFVVLTHLEDLDDEQIAHAVELTQGKVGEQVPVLAVPLEDIDALELLSLAEEAFDRSDLGEDPAESDHGHDHDHDHGEHGHGHHHHSTEGVESHAFFPQAAFTAEELNDLMELFNAESAGIVLRAKGFLMQEDAGMVLFEQVYGSGSIEPTAYARDPKFVVIGKDLDEAALRAALKA